MRPPPAFRHRDFRFFWSGLLASGVGSQFTTVAMAWQIYLITNSPLQLGLLGLARAIPQMAVTVLGGVLADRRDRRSIMMVCQVAEFCVSSSLVAFTVSGHMRPAVLYAAAVLLALCTAIETPARTAIIPNLVPAEDLTSALALNATQRNLGSIVGPALAGIALAAIGAQICYAVDAFSWLVMLAALFAMRTRAFPLQVGRTGTLAAIGEGLVFVWAHPVILSCMIMDFGATFFGSARALYPIYARDILRVGAAGLGLLYTAEAAGSMVAAGVISVRSAIRRAGLWTLAGVAVYGGCAALFALSHVFWLSLLLLACVGAGNIVSAILRGTINQLATPDHLRGRVSAVNAVFVQGGPQLGQFESGVVAQSFGTEVSALSGGLATLALVAVIAALPWVRRYQIEPKEPAIEATGEPAR